MAFDRPDDLRVLWQRWRAAQPTRTRVATHEHRDLDRLARSSDESGQPYPYQRVELVEPDWTRFPGWKDVTAEDWASVQWQRAHCVKNVKQLRELLGDLVDERFYADLERDQAERATMSMLVPPQMMNTMVPHEVPSGPGSLTEAFYADPVRHYMIPVFSDRRTDWSSHPHATRDSLHEHDMWVAEGLTHRYPTKVLAELLPTCPQYCGHCTRMDLVGNSTAGHRQAEVRRQAERPARRHDRLPAAYAVGARRRGLRRRRREHAVAAARGVPDVGARGRQHPRHPARHQGADRPAAALAAGRRARGHGPGRRRSPARAASRSRSTPTPTTPTRSPRSSPRRPRAMLDAGVRDVRNQGVLLNGVNADPHALLDLCFRLLDGAQIMPYYFYMCDMIPFSEHWRVSVADAQRLQHHIMGYLPGFATPRIVCDVPFVGKRWVHQLADYDTERGISYWTKNYRTSIEADLRRRALADLRVLRPDPHPARSPARRGGPSTPTSTRVRAQGRRGGRGVAPYGGAPGLVTCRGLVTNRRDPGLRVAVGDHTASRPQPAGAGQVR